MGWPLAFVVIKYDDDDDDDDADADHDYIMIEYMWIYVIYTDLLFTDLLTYWYADVLDVLIDWYADTQIYMFVFFVPKNGSPFSQLQFFMSCPSDVALHGVEAIMFLHSKAKEFEAIVMACWIPSETCWMYKTLNGIGGREQKWPETHGFWASNMWVQQMFL